MALVVLDVMPEALKYILKKTRHMSDLEGHSHLHRPLKMEIREGNKKITSDTHQLKNEQPFVALIEHFLNCETELIKI